MKKRMVIEKQACLVLFTLILLSFAVSASPDLEVSSLLLKISLKEDESALRSFTITSPDGSDYSLEVISVPGLKLSEQSFVLGEGEKKLIDVTFDSRGVASGVYVGSIDITSLKETLSLPVILEVESQDIFFDANLDIPPAYTEIEPGGKMVAQVKIFDLTSGGGTSEGTNSLGTVSVDLEYNVFDLKGNVLSSESERMVIDKQTQVTKTFSFPEKIDEGDYVMSVIAKYGSSVGISSQMFSISKPIVETSYWEIFGSGSILIFVLVLVFTLAIVFLFVYILREKDKFVLELKKYHENELEMQRKMLMDQARFLGDKGVERREINQEVSKQIRKLKIEQAKRINELKVLKSKGEIDEMKNKVKEWENRGYETSALKYRLDKMSVKDMRELMSKWKKKGYK